MPGPAASSLRASVRRSPLLNCLSIIENPICYVSRKISFQPRDKLPPFIVLPSRPPPSPWAFNYIHHLPPLRWSWLRVSPAQQGNKALFFLLFFFSPLGFSNCFASQVLAREAFSSRCEISARIGIYFKTPAFTFFIKPFSPCDAAGCCGEPEGGNGAFACPARREGKEDFSWAKTFGHTRPVPGWSRAARWERTPGAPFAQGGLPRTSIPAGSRARCLL